jgi:two-component system nitrate/nitrite response regulator NarL
MSSTSPNSSDDAIVRVFCVDDHAIFLEGLRGFFGIMASRGERIAFAGSAQDSQSALSQIMLVRPDLLLLDVWLSRRPGYTGLDLLRNLRNNQIDIPVIAYSGILLSEAQLLEFLELDLDGYLLKDGNPQNVLAAVLQVMDGKSYFCPEIEPLLKRIRSKRVKTIESRAGLPFYLLSQQERLVLQQILKGVPRKDIADFLKVTRSSIDTYRRRIIQKLGIQDFAELDIPQVLKELVLHEDPSRG